MDQEDNVNLIFCVVTWVRMASPNIFAKSSNSTPPPHFETKYAIYYLRIGAKQWKSSNILHVLQVHILHNIALKTLKLTNMCKWNFSGPKFIQ